MGNGPGHNAGSSVETFFTKISEGNPDVSLDQLRRFLADEYGLDLVTATVLGGEIDQNLRAVCSDGNSYVVKIFSDTANPTDLAWRRDLLRHLAEHAPELPLPRPRSTRSGEDTGVLRRGDRANHVQLMRWLEGRPLGSLGRRSPGLLRDIGAAAATLVRALDQFSAPPAGASHHWEIIRADKSVASCLPFVTDPERVALIERLMHRYAACRDRLADLPMSVVHNDLNDFNIIVASDDRGRHCISGIIDFGDALHTIRVAELAIATAYAMLNTPDPLRAATDVVRGYAATGPLEPDEIAVLLPLAAARLCVNATTWTRRITTTGHDYGAARMQYTWSLLAALDRIPLPLAEAALRHAAGQTVHPGASSARAALSAGIRSTAIPLNRHLEASPSRPPVLACQDPQPATLELGVYMAAELPTMPVSPLDGVVEKAHAESSGLVLRHASAPATVWSVWTGIHPLVNAGEAVAAGQPVATLAGNGAGGAPAHLAFVVDGAFADIDLPTRIQPWLRPVWWELSPDPLPLLGPSPAPDQAVARDAVTLREAHTGRAQRFYYKEPMSLVDSGGVWLVDVDGMRYLDVINNVTHVGHASPTVAAAVSRQVNKLNTNSRFVYPEFAQYARRLAGLLPDPLSVIYFVCTGSEANDLALRMARHVTGRRDVMVVDGAYHGNTTAVLEISPDRYNGPGGGGRPPTTHPVVQPNRYRGPYSYDDPEAGVRYAADVAAVAGDLIKDDRAPAAFFTESLIGSGGEITLPPGYLESAFAAVRDAGGLCVADEVQVGFGRLGALWGFQLQDVVPDIVTLGKPMANGMPLAAVVTTADIAADFDSGMRYFNTFAGNPVSCAAGMAVLDVIERDGLLARAKTTGKALLSRLGELQERHPLIGDVRGQGMYLGIELVRDRQHKTPAGDEAMHISERLRERGVVIYPNGPDNNVLKIKPPLVFGDADVDLFVDSLDQVLSEDW